MFDCFTNTPDFTAFDAVTNAGAARRNESAGEGNQGRAIAEGRNGFRPKLPLDKEDECPEDLFNRHCCGAMAKGPQVPYPNWAVKAVDDDD